MTTTTLELPDDVRQALDDLAERTGRSRIELIREALSGLLAQHKTAPSRSPLPRSIGMIDDPGISGADSEDWLKANWRPEDDRGRVSSRLTPPLSSHS